MHKIMAELHQDHIHLTRLLNMLDEQVEFLGSDGDPDFFLMIDIANYIQHYPDLVHHPKEDQVYRVLRERTDKWTDIVDSLLDEHRHLPEVTLEFLNLLEGAASSYSIVSREDLKEKIENFIKIEREHMNKEENTIFPLIEKTLNEQDWEAVETNLIKKTDPLFGAQVEQSYENLYQSIKSQGT